MKNYRANRAGDKGVFISIVFDNQLVMKELSRWYYENHMHLDADQVMAAESIFERLETLIVARQARMAQKVQAVQQMLQGPSQMPTGYTQTGQGSNIPSEEGQT